MAEGSDFNTHYYNILADYKGNRRRLLDTIDRLHAGGDPLRPPTLEELETMSDQHDSRGPSTISKGFQSGMHSTAGMLSGAAAIAGGAVGWDGLRDAGYAGYQDQMEKAADIAPPITDVRDIHSWSDTATWFMGTVGQLAPTMATIAVSSIVGGGIIGVAAKKAAKETIEKAVTTQFRKEMIKGTARRQAKIDAEKFVMAQVAKKSREAGVILGSGALEGGGMYGESADEVGIENASPYTAIGLGLVSGATELAGPEGKYLTRGFMPGKGKFRHRLARKMMTDPALEGGQEMTQQALSEINLLANNPDHESDPWDYVNAGAAGVVGGGMFAGVGAIRGEKAPATPEEAAAMEMGEAPQGEIRQIEYNPPGRGTPWDTDSNTTPPQAGLQIRPGQSVDLMNPQGGAEGGQSGWVYPPQDNAGGGLNRQPVAQPPHEFDRADPTSWNPAEQSMATFQDEEDQRLLAAQAEAPRIASGTSSPIGMDGLRGQLQQESAQATPEHRARVGNQNHIALQDEIDTYPAPEMPPMGQVPVRPALTADQMNLIMNRNQGDVTPTAYEPPASPGGLGLDPRGGVRLAPLTDQDIANFALLPEAQQIEALYGLRYRGAQTPASESFLAILEGLQEQGAQRAKVVQVLLDRGRALGQEAEAGRRAQQDDLERDGGQRNLREQLRREQDPLYAARSGRQDSMDVAGMVENYPSPEMPPMGQVPQRPELTPDQGQFIMSRTEADLTPTAYETPEIPYGVGLDTSGGNGGPPRGGGNGGGPSRGGAPPMGRGPTLATTKKPLDAKPKPTQRQTEKETLSEQVEVEKGVWVQRPQAEKGITLTPMHEEVSAISTPASDGSLRVNRAVKEERFNTYKDRQKLVDLWNKGMRWGSIHTEGRTWAGHYYDIDGNRMDESPSEPVKAPTDTLTSDAEQVLKAVKAGKDPHDAMRELPKDRHKRLIDAIVSIGKKRGYVTDEGKMGNKSVRKALVWLTTKGDHDTPAKVRRTKEPWELFKYKNRPNFSVPKGVTVASSGKPYTERGAMAAANKLRKQGYREAVAYQFDEGWGVRWGDLSTEEADGTKSAPSGHQVGTKSEKEPDIPEGVRLSASGGPWVKAGAVKFAQRQIRMGKKAEIVLLGDGHYGVRVEEVDPKPEKPQMPDGPGGSSLHGNIHYLKEYDGYATLTAEVLGDLYAKTTETNRKALEQYYRGPKGFVRIWEMDTSLSDKDLRDALLNDAIQGTKSGPSRDQVGTKSEKGPVVTGKQGTTFLHDNTPVEFTYAVVEAADLVASHDKSLNINPHYPKALQPRDRARAGMKLQVEELANKLNPARLGENASVSSGAPILSPDGLVVESGNGRTLAIRKAYEVGPKGQAYKTWLEKNADTFGVDPDAVRHMAQPVLVRQRAASDMDAASFAKKANVSDLAKMSPTEQAISDAETLDQGDLALFNPTADGDLTSGGNRAFVNRFIKKMGVAEQAGYLTEDGRATKQLVDRIQAAVFYKAYGSKDLLALTAEEADPDIKNILNGLTVAVPGFVKARGIEETLGGLNIIDSILSGVAHLKSAKAAYPNIMATPAQKHKKGRTKAENQVRMAVDQTDLFSADATSKEAQAVSVFLAANTFKAKRIGEFFKSIADQTLAYVADLSQLEVFGGKAKKTAASIIENATATIEDRYEDKNTDLFPEEKPAEPPFNYRKSDRKGQRAGDGRGEADHPSEDPTPSAEVSKPPTEASAKPSKFSRPKERFVVVSKELRWKKWEIEATTDDIVEYVRTEGDTAKKFYDFDDGRWVDPGKRGPIKARWAREQYGEVPTEAELEELLNPEHHMKTVAERKAEVEGAQDDTWDDYFKAEHARHVLHAKILRKPYFKGAEHHYTELIYSVYRDYKGDEQEAETPESPDTITNDGRPFTSKGDLTLAIIKAKATKTHDAVEVDGGWIGQERDVPVIERSAYDDKKEDRADRYRDRAAKARRESNASVDRSRNIVGNIPMGQPILVGHHSEKRHRRDLERSDNAMRRAVEADKKANHYDDKADAAEHNNAISSDDSNAIVKLREKIRSAEQSQEAMKAINKIIKSKKLTDDQKVAKIVETTGYTEADAQELVKPDFAGREGFASYKLSNNNANITRMKKRLKGLETQAEDETTEVAFDGGTLTDNVEDNRVQIFFDGKPDAEIRTQLKRAGFRWAPSVGAWQRQRSRPAMWEAKRIVGYEEDDTRQYSTATSTDPSTDPHTRVRERIEAKYADLLASPETGDDPYNLWDRIQDQTLTPRALAKLLEEHPDAAPSVQSIVADQIGELVDTHSYESHKDGSRVESYIDSLLKVLDPTTKRSEKGRRTDFLQIEAKRIEAKYAPIMELPEVTGLDPIYDRIENGTVTPKELQKHLSLADNKKTETDRVNSLIADQIGDLIETHLYEGKNDGQKIETYLDSLLEVTGGIPRDALHDPRTGTRAETGKRAVPNHRRVTLPQNSSNAQSLGGVTRAELEALPMVTKITGQDGDYTLHFNGGISVPLATIEAQGDDAFLFTPQGEKLLKRGWYDGQGITVTQHGDKHTVSHELLHFMEDTGVVTPKDQGILNRAARKAEGLGLKAGDMAEARARFIEGAMRDREAHRGTKIGAILQKIADFIDQLVNVFRRTARGVVRDFEGGNFKAGKATSAKGLATQHSSQKLTQTPAFKRWFGNSKVVGEEGEPVVMYHGSGAVFESFETIDRGAWFSADAEMANSYAGDRPSTAGGVSPQVYPVYLQVKNPATEADIYEIAKEFVRDAEHYAAFELIEFSKTLEALKKKGFDGAYIENDYSTSDYKTPRPSWAVFSPNQIKSTFNTGTFDSTDARIQYSLSREDFTEARAAVYKAVEETGKLGVTMMTDFSWWKGLYEDITAESVTNDTSLWSKAFSLISSYSRKVGGFRRAYLAAEGKDGRKSEVEHDVTHSGDVNMLKFVKDFRKASKEAYGKLSSYLNHRDVWQIGYDVIKGKAEGAPYVLHDLDGKATEHTSSDAEELWEIARQRERDEYLAETKDKEGAKALYYTRKVSDAEFLGKYAKYLEYIEFLTANDRPTTVVHKTADGKSVEVDLDLALKELGSRRAYYMPRIWLSGNFNLFLKKEGEHFNILEKFDNVTRARRRARVMAAKGYTYRIAAAEKPAEEFYLNLASTAAQETMTNAVLGRMGKYNKVLQLEDIGLHGRAKGKTAYAIRGVVDAETEALFRSLGGLKKERRVGGYWIEWWFNDKTEAFAEEIRGRVFDLKAMDQNTPLAMMKEFISEYANIIKSRGARQSLIKRSDAVGHDVYTGYEEDLTTRLSKSVLRYAGGVAKQEMAEKMIKAINGHDVSWDEFQEIKKFKGTFETWEEGSEIDRETFDEIRNHWVAEPHYEDYQEFVEGRKIHPAKQRNAYDDAMNFFRHMLRNDEALDRVLGFAKGLAVLKYLGGRPAAAVVNITNMVAAVPAVISAGTKIPLKSTFKLIGQGMERHVAYKTGKAQAGSAEESAEALRVFQYIERMGWDQAHLNSEAVGALQSTGSRAFSTAVDWSMWLFGVSESMNRGATIYAAFKAQGNKGTFKERMTKAHELSNDSHGVYSKANKPAIMRGGGILANTLQAAYVFRTFAHNYMVVMLRLGLKEKEAKAALHMALFPAIFGAGSSVGISALIQVVGKLLGSDDPEEDVYRTVADNFGATPAKLVRFGLPGLVGVDLTGNLRIGIGDVPTTGRDFFGAPGDVVLSIGEGLGEIRKGNVRKGVERLLPNAVGNISKGFREHSQGITTRSNSPVFYQGERLRADAMDRFLRVMSFNPARISQARAELWSERKKELHYQDARREVYDRIRLFQSKPQRTRSDWLDIVATVQGYNADIPANIKPIDLKKEAKRIAKAMKKRRVK